MTRWMIAVAALAVTAPEVAAREQRPIGDTRVVTRIPADPGYPEGIAVRGASVYVTGPAALGTSGKRPSYVNRYRIATGELQRSYDIEGEDLMQEHASSALAFDAADRVYALGTQFGVVRIDETTGTQSRYADPLPDMPTCTASPGAAPCSPTPTDRPPLPNDMAFDAAGNLYITDSFQATIFRVPAGGGRPVPWFQSAVLDRDGFGANGIRFDRTGTRLYVSITGPSRAGIYSLSVTGDGGPGAWQLVHAYGSDDGPDGFAVGSDGGFVVALAFANQISILDADGSERLRFPGALENQRREIPYANPSGVALAGDGAAMITNHAIFDPLPATKFAVFDAWVGDRGLPLTRPAVP